jgi:DNA-binding winged helix-turn-helix (wHTH) protein
VLQYLVEHARRVVTKAELRRQMWVSTHVAEAV